MPCVSKSITQDDSLYLPMTVGCLLLIHIITTTDVAEAREVQKKATAQYQKAVDVYIAVQQAGTYHADVDLGRPFSVQICIFILSTFQPRKRCCTRISLRLLH